MNWTVDVETFAFDWDDPPPHPGYVYDGLRRRGEFMRNTHDRLIRIAGERTTHHYVVFLIHPKKAYPTMSNGDNLYGYVNHDEDDDDERRYAYVFDRRDRSNNWLYWLIAHELGHGQNLKEHPFEEGDLDFHNLMNYNQTTALRKNQWDVLNPQEEDDPPITTQ